MTVSATDSTDPKPSFAAPREKPTAQYTSGGAASGGRAEGDRAEGGFRSREGGRDFGADRPKVGAMEVAVEHNIERAMKVLKRKLIREGLFKELKARRYYEKPSERKKRKHKESLKKSRKEEARARRSSQLL